MKKAAIEVYDVTTNMFICFLHNNYITRKGYEIRFENYDVIFYQQYVYIEYSLEIDIVKLYWNLLLPFLFSNQITLVYILGLTCLSC